MPRDARESFQDLVKTLRDLGAAIGPANAARFEASPRSAAGGSTTERGISNPTLDTVLDPARLEVSEELAATATALRQARALIDPRLRALRRAVARWEGEDTE